MALARVKVWVAGEVLYAADQNAEFNNILNNALSLISPLTGNLDVSTNELLFTSAGADATASGRLRRNGTWLTWHDGVGARGTMPKIIRKTSDETVNGSNTLQNDDALVYALAASEKVVFQCFIAYNSGATPDIKAAFTVPASATIVWNTASAVADAGGTVQMRANRTTSGTAMDLQGTGGDATVLLVGTVINSTNAGDLQLQWAQNTSDASDTKVLANSWLRVEKTV